MSDAVVIVRSRQRLNELVAQHITKPFSADVLALNPGLVPDYTTWAGMELVIRNREEAGFAWDMVYGNPTNYAVTIYDRYCNVLGQELHKDKSVAFCLAALASAGCRVKLELDECPMMSEEWQAGNPPEPYQLPKLK